MLAMSHRKMIVDGGGMVVEENPCRRKIETLKNR